MLSAKFTIQFIVDANSKIGIGHLVRCLALAGELKNYLDCRMIFVMADSTAGKNEVLKCGYEVKNRLPNGMTDVIITSLPKIGRDYSKELKNKTKLLVILDESVETDFFADIVVRGTTVLEFRKSVTNHKIKFLSGPKYVILNNKFKELNLKRKEIKPAVATIIITVGGSDINNLTPKIMSALNGLGDIKKTVIVGPAFRNTSQISRYKNYDVRCGATDLAKLMFSADLAISGGGMTMYELASVGTPSITLCQTPDQLMEANIFKKKVAIVNLGMGKKITEGTIRRNVEALLKNRKKRETMSRVGKKIIDGRGALRVAREIVSKIN